MDLTVIRDGTGYTIVCDDAILTVPGRSAPLVAAGDAIGGLAGRLAGHYLDRVVEQQLDRNVKGRSPIKNLARVGRVVTCQVADLPPSVRDHLDWPKSVSLSRELTVIPREHIESAKLSLVFGLQLLLARGKGKREREARRLLVWVGLTRQPTVKRHLKDAGYPIAF